MPCVGSSGHAWMPKSSAWVPKSSACVTELKLPMLMLVRPSECHPASGCGVPSNSSCHCMIDCAGVVGARARPAGSIGPETNCGGAIGRPCSLSDPASTIALSLNWIPTCPFANLPTLLEGKRQWACRSEQDRCWGVRAVAAGVLEPRLHGGSAVSMCGCASEQIAGAHVHVLNFFCFPRDLTSELTVDYPSGPHLWCVCDSGST